MKEINYQTFNNLYDTEPKAKTICWDELKDRAVAPIPYSFPNKNLYPMWNFATGGCNAVNLTQLDVLVLDYDGTDTNLGFWYDIDFEYLIHQTLSSDAERPRYRVLVPLSEPISAKCNTHAYYQLFDYLEQAGGLDGMDFSCCTLGRRFFQPIGGKNLKLEKFWVRFPVVKKTRLWQYRPSEFTDFEPPQRKVSTNYKDRVHNQGRNTTLGSMCSAMIYNGEDDNFIKSELLFYDEMNEIPLFSDPTETYFNGNVDEAVMKFITNFRKSIGKKLK